MEDLSEAIRLLRSEEKKTSVAEPAPRPYAEPRNTPPAAKPAPPPSKKDEDEEEPEIEELPAEDLEIGPVPRAAAGATLESIWQPLLAALKGEKMSVASYMAEGEPLSFKNGVALIAFPQKYNFHKETLEVADNKKLIEKHLSALLGAEVLIEFQMVKEVSVKKAGAFAAEAPASPEVDNAVKSAMNMFGGRVVDR